MTKTSTHPGAVALRRWLESMKPIVAEAKRLGLPNPLGHHKGATKAWSDPMRRPARQARQRQAVMDQPRLHGRWQAKPKPKSDTR